MFPGREGFSEGFKVFESTDGGTLWENISYNLPNVPATTIAYQAGTDDAIYVGTDLGVFYKNNTLDEWIDFSNGMPNVVLGEIEIHYASGKLRAGSYGRGLWESELMDPNILWIGNAVDVEFSLYPNPVSDVLNINLNTTQKQIVEFSLCNAAGIKIFENCITTEGGFNRHKLPVSHLPNGIYFLRVKTKDGVSMQKLLKQ